MKRVLITGENSYIGQAVAKYLSTWPNEFLVNTISVRGNDWINEDFSKYDTIFHVAGIAHADTGKVSEEQKQLYYQVNCDLSYDVANKYKQDRFGKASQFIYMSSIIVYDDKTNVKKKRVITGDTKPNPTSFYGDSKLKAEQKISELECQNFNVAIVRPPMIYGPNSKGNYPTLKKLALKLPVFPKIDNKRSMLYVGNLAEFIKQLINIQEGGIYFPQNKEYVSTWKLVEKISNTHNKRIYMTTVFNFVVIFLSYIPGKIGNLTNKAFGNLVYSTDLENENINDYNKYSFQESIVETEKGR